MRRGLLAALLLLAAAAGHGQSLGDRVCGTAADVAAALRAGADPAAPDDAGHTPLQRLFRCEAPSEPAAVAALLLDALQPDRDTLVHHLADALWHDATAPVRALLIERGAEPARLQRLTDRDLAWRLAERGDAATLDWLLAHGWSLAVPSPAGFPPLYFASEQAVALLLARGADPALRSDVVGTVLVPVATPPAAYPGVDPANLVTRERSRMLVNAGFPLDLRDVEGHTSLQLAVAADDLWLVRYLLARGADPALHAPGTESVLAQAVHRGRLPVVQALLRAHPTALLGEPELLLDYLDSPDPDPVIVEALLVAGAVPGSNARGEPALVIAARRQHWRLIPLLLAAGADPEATNAQGCTLHCYAWAMPDALRDRLQQGRHRPWVLPHLDTHPGGFFALAMVPVLMLWLARVAWRLARREGIGAPTLQMLAALALAVAGGGALFYRCDPCVLVGAGPQLALTAAVALLSHLLLWGVFRVRSRYA